MDESSMQDGTPYLTAHQAVARVASIYEASRHDRNGRLRKKPFFKALAMLKALMGLAVDGVLPQEVFEALEREAGKAEGPRSAQGQPKNGNAGQTSPAQHQIAGLINSLPSLYKNLLKKNPHKFRVVCVKILKERLGLKPGDRLPNAVLAALMQSEQKLPQIASAERPTVQKPIQTKQKLVPQITSAKKSKAARRKHTPTRIPRGTYQELPERSVWTGAPWDHYFEKYR